MAVKTTDSIWSDSNKVGTSTGAGWLSCPISTLTNALNNTNNVPSNAKITKVKMHVTADFDCGMGLANVYLRYGFGGTNSINEYLLQGSGEGVKFTKTTPLEYPEDGVDITGYLSKDTSPFAFTTTYGSYLAFRFYSTNIFSKTYYVNSLTLEITYEIHNHSYTTVISETAATCLSSGSRTKKCSCGATTTETISALGHSFGSTTAAKAATCTAAGNSAYKKCSRCNLYFAGNAATNASGGKSDTSSYVIAAKGHTQVTIPAVAPTCTDTGLTEGKKCSVCGTVTVVQTTVSALGHNYLETVTPPTDAERGYTTHSCDGCGDSFVDSFVYRVIAKADNDSHGTVTGGGDYESGKTVIITATPSVGFRFVRWSDGITSLTRTVVVTENSVYVAEFVVDKVNKFIADVAQSSGVLSDYAEPFEILADSIKVYG